VSTWKRLQDRLSKPDFAASRVLVGLDFDGTLADIVPTPEHAAMSAKTLGLLSALAARKDTTVAVISGRSLEDIRRLVPVPGVYLAGNHGLQIEGPGLSWRHPQAAAFDPAFWKTLEWEVRDIPGTLLEHKRLGVAVHYRKVPPRHVRRLSERLRVRLGGLRDRYRVLRSKKTFDIRPVVPWDKGHAFNAIRDRLPGGWLGIFIGDDKTDEEGFATLGRRALTVRVGRVESSAAQFILSHRGQVDRLMAALAVRRSGA
jgi:trehalose 6-phosphate phosphatase